MLMELDLSSPVEHNDVCCEIKGAGVNVHVLFQIRNNTFIEIRDCSILSKNMGSVMDTTFLMNEKDLIDDQSLSPAYRGILSVKSCTIAGFSYGFMVGSGSILSIELSSISNMRSVGVLAVNPKILKVSGTMLDNGIESTCKYGI